MKSFNYSYRKCITSGCLDIKNYNKYLDIFYINLNFQHRPWVLCMFLDCSPECFNVSLVFKERLGFKLIPDSTKYYSAKKTNLIRLIVVIPLSIFIIVKMFSIITSRRLCAFIIWLCLTRNGTTKFTNLIG